MALPHHQASVQVNNPAGKLSEWPGQFTGLRSLNHDPRDNRLRNLHALCRRCRLLHDRTYHRAQPWKTMRRRWAMGDLFLGLYA
ncbi:hypothetical protein [Teichococcus aestuarii]|uniref:hypothetical protein n=1 Tax=Teichococcus aestuarii TaxID=568898 RepID=UPI0036170308